ncbi:MAG: prolipoprotein diacylglyceryl transferase [Legionellaceae bacterium]|nr:prolipoprotein diacylglyceryl transferase [Legionellaceae bacterium]
MFIYPELNPVAFSIGPLKIHWYGLMYLIGFFMAWLLGRYRLAYHNQGAWTKLQLDDMIFYGALGAIIGGRVGYMLFYDTEMLWEAPLTIFKIWEGGMSFHGGLLGVFFAECWLAHRWKRSVFQITDFIVPLVPLGLGAGRIGNFINGELWGRPTSLPWGMVFPTADGQPRHPSQLYEAGLEGIILFIVIWIYARKPRPVGCVSAVFLMGYAVCRILVECVRRPDPQIGFVLFHQLTLGQCLSIPMLCLGCWIWWRRRCASI